MKKDYRLSSEQLNLWDWQLYVARDIPENLVQPGQGITCETRIPCGDTLRLPDGRVLSAMPISIPETGLLNLWDVLPERPVVLERSLLIGELFLPEEMTCRFGFGVDWESTLYLNGTMLMNLHPQGNVEIPILPDNHIVNLHLKAGKNQIVLELYGGEASFKLGMCIYSPKDQLCLTYGPWAHQPDTTASAMTISFTTSRPCAAGVQFRRANCNDTWATGYDLLGGQIRRDRTAHNIRLTHLEPDTDYEARPILLPEEEAFQEIPVEEANVHFRTAPSLNTDHFSFIATGDLQQAGAPRNDFLTGLLQSSAGQNASFFTYLGDVAWTSDFEEMVLAQFITPYTEITAPGKPLVMLRGNHEYYGKESNHFFDYFSMPYPGREGYGLWRYGNVCFIQLDCGDDAPRQPLPSTRVLNCQDPYFEEQRAWLKQAVQTAECQNAAYRIVLAHGTPLGDLQPYMPANIRKMIDGIFTGPKPLCKIHLWLAGHIHYAFRNVPGTNQFRSSLPLCERYKKAQPQPYLGEKFTFPILTCCGKLGGLNTQTHLYSSMEIQVTPQKITVIQRDTKQQEFDRIEVSLDYTTTALFSREDFPLQAFN